MSLSNPIAPPAGPLPLTPCPPRSERATWRARVWTHGSTWASRLLSRCPGTGALHRQALRRLTMPEVPVPLPGLAPELRGLRLAFLSDLHTGCFMGRGDLVRLFQRIERANPDLLCLGGDLINSRSDELDQLIAVLPEKRPALGIFAVPGNHDVTWCPIDRWTRQLEDAGVTVLLNRGVRLGDGPGALWLCGVDDYGEGSPDLDRALHGRSPPDATVLLAHHPDYFALATARGIPLTLSGHTHGGQVRPFGQVLLRHSRLGFHGGLYRHGDCRLLVSRGAGVTLLPIRWNAPPEVPVLVLDGPSTTAPALAWVHPPA